MKGQKKKSKKQKNGLQSLEAVVIPKEHLLGMNTIEKMKFFGMPLMYYALQIGYHLSKRNLKIIEKINFSKTSEIQVLFYLISILLKQMNVILL